TASAYRRARSSLSSHLMTWPILRWAYLFSPLFFFNDTPPTEIYTLSLHDALPISDGSARSRRPSCGTASPSRSATCARPPWTSTSERTSAARRRTTSSASTSSASGSCSRQDEITESLRHVEVRRIGEGRTPGG